MRNRGPLPLPSALHFESTAQFPRGQRAAVQPEAVAIFSRGKTVAENARQIFLGNAHAIIRDGYSNECVSVSHPASNPFFSGAGFFAGLLRISNEVPQNLQGFLFFF